MQILMNKFSQNHPHHSRTKDQIIADVRRQREEMDIKFNQN